MAYEISRREVMNNLVRFKDSLLEMKDLDTKSGRSKKRVYKLLLNRKTGDMRFAKKITALEYRISKKTVETEAAGDWKEVRMVVFEKKKAKPSHFEINDPHDAPLKPSDVDPLAWKIASETLTILNQKAAEIEHLPESVLPEEAVLEDLSSIHLGAPKEEIEDLPGWMGTLDRLEAELRLNQKPVGTYLLREGDKVTRRASYHIGEENFLSIHPYVLTVVEEEGKISDILILKTNMGWMFYHDNPNLKDKDVYSYYSSPRELLGSIQKVARYPLF